MLIDIQDEFDAEEASILKIDDTTFSVAGSVNITDFMEHFDLEDEYEKIRKMKLIRSAVG